MIYPIHEVFTQCSQGKKLVRDRGFEPLTPSVSKKVNAPWFWETLWQSLLTRPKGNDRYFLRPVNSRNNAGLFQVLQGVLAGVPTIDRAWGVGAVERELAAEGDGKEVPGTLVEGRHERPHRLLPHQVVAVRAELMVAARPHSG